MPTVKKKDGTKTDFRKSAGRTGAVLLSENQFVVEFSLCIQRFAVEHDDRIVHIEIAVLGCMNHFIASCIVSKRHMDTMSLMGVVDPAGHAECRAGTGGCTARKPRS